MFDKKKIKLKNGKTATLYHTSFPEQNIITAQDFFGHIIAKCAYSILYTFSHEINNPANNLPSKTIYHKFGKNIIKEKDFNGEYLKLKITDNKEVLCQLEKKECELLHIEILDEKYFQVGLGSAMFKEIEQIAKEDKCERIYAKYSPFGNFSMGSYSFYIRNGFHFETSNKGEKIAVKMLSKDSNNIDNSTKEIGNNKW